jgi:hypothetical protein
MGRMIVNVPCKDVQCDEIWAFVQKKEGNKAPFEAHNAARHACDGSRHHGHGVDD